jgi:ribosomal protein S12 methylthiotransferase
MNKIQKTAHIISLGCVKNTVDSEIIMGGLKKANIRILDEAAGADTVIINTCGFIGDAKKESIETILEVVELKKEGSVSQVLVAGCLSARYTDDLKKEIPEVDAFFLTEDFDNIFKHVTHKSHLADDPNHLRSLMTPPHYSYLKISEGCDNVCSFCAIPIMRGLQRSRTIESLVSEANLLAKNGVKELMIIGQDTTTYGWDLKPKQTLHGLLYELDKVEGLKWIRLHYAHPSHFNRKLIPLFANAKRIVPYLDIPIQHASTKMLKNMKRGLDNDGLRRLFTDIRAQIPQVALRTSVIVGYPGETEDDFNTLMDFLEEFKFERLGVFTYSEEEGTSAASDLDDVPEDVKMDRMDAIMDLQHGISWANNQDLIGKELHVIVDKPDPENEGYFIGRTIWDAPDVDNEVIIIGDVNRSDFVRVHITDAGPYELYAEPI